MVIAFYGEAARLISTETDPGYDKSELSSICLLTGAKQILQNCTDFAGFYVVDVKIYSEVYCGSTYSL